jgi:integrase
MSPTLSEAWDMFVTERSIALCPTTLTSDYRQVRTWLKRCPHQDFSEGRKILTWVLQQKPVRASRRVAMYVKSLYRWAAQEDIDLITKNPIQTFRMPKAPQRDEEIIVIPRNEIPLLLIALKYKHRYRHVDWSLYAEFMLQTAMRTGEVRALKWTDVKDNRVIVHSNYTLTHGLKNSTKTNKKRSVPLNARCLEILNEVGQKDEFIFPWDRLAFQSFFRKRAETLFEAGLADKCYRPYDLRHTAISRWIEAQIPVTQVATWAGNTSEVIWKHYANTTTEYELPVL